MRGIDTAAQRGPRNCAHPGAAAILDALYPLSFDIESPTPGTGKYLRDPTLSLLVDFFRTKGTETLKQEDRQEAWYGDWISYQARHKIYACVLSPQRYSSQGNSFRFARLTRLWEAFGYFSPAHAYSLHTSFLGLFPILLGHNEELKKEAIDRLENGGLFAFGVSERTHGSDLFANEFTVQKTTNGWLAEGAKCYIGNTNAACLISILAKKTEAASPTTGKRAPFLFFALRPGESTALQNVRKIRTMGIRAAFVGEFEVHQHAFTDGDIISQGRDAWDAVLATVNFGKFLLGFGAVGICSHAFAEAFVHMRRRVLYGKPVMEMPHIRAATVCAHARLCAMKFFAYRALDYLQIACDDDRRYLLYAAVQKARVSTEGVKVMAILSECVGAKGFDATTHFESAIRDAMLIPGLEGSTHINHGLVAQFLDNYYSESCPMLPAPESVILADSDAGENDYWFLARDRNARTVGFGNSRRAYEPLRASSNVETFMAQAEAFRNFALQGNSALNPNGSIALAIAIGRCFSVIVYAQLVAENCQLSGVALSTVSIIFHALVEDLSAEALTLSALFPAESDAATRLKDVIQVPRTSVANMEEAWNFLAQRYGN